EAGFDGSAHGRRVTGMVAGAAPAPLRGDDDRVATARDRSTEHLLGLAAAVRLGGVEVVDARLDRRVDHRCGSPGIDAHPEVVAPEADDGHLELADRSLFDPPTLSSAPSGQRMVRRGTSRPGASR